MLEIVQLHDLIDKDAVPFKVTDTAKIYRLPNGELLKIGYSKNKERFYEAQNHLYDSLKHVEEINSISNVAWPTRVVHDTCFFSGYTMPEIAGIDLDTFALDLTDLYEFAEVFIKIENVVKEGHKLNVVFPDLCNGGNIIITPEGNAVFIDFDGIQPEGMSKFFFAKAIGKKTSKMSSKYFDKNLNRFTKELDVKSVIFLYFDKVFNIKLGRISPVRSLSKIENAIDRYFASINLDDPIIKRKVLTLYIDAKRNEFLGEDMYRLAEANTLETNGKRRFLLPK